jgi:hypothetical protein
MVSSFCFIVYLLNIRAFLLFISDPVKGSKVLSSEVQDLMVKGLRLAERFALGLRPEQSVCQPPTSILQQLKAWLQTSDICPPNNPEP